MNRPKNFRAYFLFAALAISGLVVLLREHRPSFLHPDLHLCAYVTTADGNVTVVDLVKLKAVARIAVGPGLSGMREHPTRPEVFGVSSTGGYVWILDPSANHFTGQVTSRIAVGPPPARKYSGSAAPAATFGSSMRAPITSRGRSPRGLPWGRFPTR